MSDLEKRLTAVEKAMETLVKSQREEVKVISTLPDTMRDLTMQSAAVQMRMATTLASTLGVAVKEMSDQGAFDVNRLIILVEHQLDLRRKNGTAEGELVLAEAFLGTLRLGR